MEERSAIMVKQRRQLIAVPEDNSNSNGDDDWVIVKKQKVTILVPPLPVANKSTTLNPGPDQMQEIPRKTVNNQSQYSTEPHLKKPLVDDQEKLTSLAPKRCIQITRKTPHQCIPTSGKPVMLDYRTSENPDQVGTSKLHNILGVPNIMKTVKPPRLLHGIGINALPDRSTLLHQRLRAINLERKLQKAGGLSQWLASLGLGQFVKLFQGKNVNKFQLVNLTMKKLKDMGADAVGPRRKLMHAIECVCQPYCFVAS
ncbi:hypothetical protein LWI28_002538 [Acer negundo]|uniref:SAM domain-containing protein n=1 Tax=Acer negundo TaxID=4023 RepID=A0AAD5I589_ACENE|nr:hypothetical protein LWI28_002538 [Acer negundo]KAK4834456.1 hypothetical protein QYF36_023223 [Acer negundo]